VEAEGEERVFKSAMEGLEEREETANISEKKTKAGNAPEEPPTRGQKLTEPITTHPTTPKTNPLVPQRTRTTGKENLGGGGQHRQPHHD